MILAQNYRHGAPHNEFANQPRFLMFSSIIRLASSCAASSSCSSSDMASAWSISWSSCSVELGSDTWSFEIESLRFSAPLPLMRYAASSLYLSTLSFGSDCALRRSLSLCPFSTPPFCSRSSAAAKSAPMPPLGY